MEITTYSKPAKPLSAAQIRIGDAERQSAVARLQDHFAAGRLSWDELDERLGIAWAARTQGDLSGLFADLPAEPTTAPSTPPPKRLRQLRQHVHFDVRFVLLVVFAATLVVATHGLLLLPLLWLRFAGGRAGRFGRPPHGHHGPSNHRGF